MVPGGCSGSPFSSRYRHRIGRKPQQKEGYQHRRIHVNRHRVFYGLFYGSRESLSESVSVVLLEGREYTQPHQKGFTAILQDSYGMSLEGGGGDPPHRGETPISTL